MPPTMNGGNEEIGGIASFNDDDDEDHAIAITPNEPVDSLSMGDERLDTILAMESDEFIKSSVENLVPIPSESEGESECDVPACFTTFLNVLFDAEYDSYSSDDQSFSMKTFRKRSIRTLFLMKKSFL
nr:hypothetical protein [Tanacetum cinerariifolium]